MTPYYKKQLERGLVFQDFVGEILWGVGIGTVSYSSRLFQQRIGENKAKIEIKFDGNRAQTGNLYIEIAEKANSRPGPYVDSGIYRDCIEYVIGDYDVIYRFSTNVLRALHGREIFKSVELSMGTSKGFLLPEAKAEGIATQVLRPAVAKDVQAVIAKQGELDREAAKALAIALQIDPAQRDLFGHQPP